jgi:hypothetical protein
MRNSTQHLAASASSRANSHDRRFRRAHSATRLAWLGAEGLTRKDVEQSSTPVHDAVESVFAKFPQAS